MAPKVPIMVNPGNTALAEHPESPEEPGESEGLHEVPQREGTVVGREGVADDCISKCLLGRRTRITVFVPGHGAVEAGYCTLGRAPTPTAWTEGRRRTLQAIHVPLITTSTAPTSTVGGVLAGPIVAAYTRLKYISTCAAAHRAPAHLGSVPERQTATPRSTMSSRAVSPNTVLANMGGSSSNSSRPARTA